MAKKQIGYKKKSLSGVNTYQILILAGLVAMLFFFSDSSVMVRVKYNKEIRGLKGQIEHYRHQIEIDKKKLYELHSDKENLEKFARENYLMKKENEEVFIIE